mmetsp:Transcript_19111/g.38992  ORF Transcript_19111/g.38992 Transcript_19111/m.38992 type:complete len:272 (+) Transcript_19111:1645-2460(+)
MKFSPSLLGLNYLKKGSCDLVQTSKFSILFPHYQEDYIRESWDIITRILKPYGLLIKADFHSGILELKTTLDVKDPFVIFKGRDFLKLIARSVPVQQASKIFEDEIFCDIIKISGYTLNREKFLKRRKRIIGNKGLTIRAIEIVTQCYLLVQGNTVSCMGNHKGLKQARKIIESCMLNIHPISAVKLLWFKRRLSKDDKLKWKSWENFLPFCRKKENENFPIKFLAHKKIKEKVHEFNPGNFLHEERGDFIDYQVITSKKPYNNLFNPLSF